MKKLGFILGIILPFLIAGLVFIVRLQMLLKSTEPAGLDGYFYALQAKSFALNGRLENPDYKIGYYLCGLFALILQNPVLGCKVYSSCISALLVYSIFYVLKSNKVDYGFCVFGEVIGSSCYAMASMSINYINNLTGITLFIFYTASVFTLISKKQKNKTDFIIPAVFFILCFLSHLVSAAFAFIFTVLMLLRKLSLKNQIAFIALAFLASLVLFSRQLPRFNAVFNLGPVFPVFSEFMVKTIGFRICFELSLLFAICWISFIAGIFISIKNKTFNILLLFIPVLFFPLWNLNVLDMGYRMLLSAAPCGIVVVIYILNKIIKTPKKTIAGLLTGIILLPGAFATKSVYDETRDPPYAYYKKVVKNIDFPDDSLLIAHLGLNHVYTYEKNLRDALNYIPDFDIPEEKLWRLAYGVNISSIKDNLYDESDETFEYLVRQIDSSYILIREDLWQKFLEREEEVYVQNYNNWYNPHTVRPSFIRKKNKIRI